jgi:hypothetical protein
MISFIKTKTELGLSINNACNILYNKINRLNFDEIEFEPFFKQYFIKCHFSRQLFSIKTSAKLLYDSILLSGKHCNEITLMDYGAGLGNLYILAKMIGVKKVIYNDLMPDWEVSARAIDIALGYEMDEYIIGDTLRTCKILLAKNISCDIITSRNVVEHIYCLESYFNILSEYQPKAILYNTTTANWRNPATHIQHILIHLRNRHVIVERKLKFIKEQISDIDSSKALQLSKLLLQHGGNDFTNAIEKYKLDHVLPKSKNDYTNYCEVNGNWAEHLIPYSTYKKYASNYDVCIKPGFWDVDYSNISKRMLGKTMNFFTTLLGNHGVVFSSFIYIIAKPQTDR